MFHQPDDPVNITARNPGGAQTIPRAVLIFGAVAGGLLILAILSWIFSALFTPRLSIAGVIEPSDPVPVDSPSTVGLKVQNDRWGDGSAFVIYTLEDGFEVRGEVIEVPAREAAEVTVTSVFPKGRRKGVMTLFDAANDNARVDARNHVRVQTGFIEPVILNCVYPAVVNVGETLVIRLLLSNEKSAEDLSVIPIAVLLDTAVKDVREVNGSPVKLPVSRAPMAVKLEMKTEGIPPGRYLLAFFLTDNSDGKRIGKGAYRRPIRLQ